MKRFLNKKVAAVGLAAGIILGSAGAAFAYFSGNGSGPGSASTGSITGTDLTISQTNTLSGLLPGGPAGTLDLTIKNTGSGSEEVGTVTGTVTAVTPGTLVGPEACSTTFYTVAPVAVNTDLAAGATKSVTTTISMSDDGNNQDNCQAANSGGAVTISYAS
jgi:hypothetical protein